jgi:TolB-like protein
MKLFDELKRRNVIKATIAYIVVAWVLLQVITSVLPNFGAPPWVLKTLMFLIAIGLPIWIIFSWVYEITPEGLKKTVKVSKDKSITEATNKRLNIVIIITLVIAIVVAFVNKPIPQISSKTIFNNDLLLDKSIAVIPFKNLSSDRENQYFADGMMDDILNQLSIIQGLEVKSRQSSERYHESIKTIRQIGAELGANYLLEGSVQKHKDSIRIIVQLIDAINDKHLWSDKYDFELKNVFTIQSEISKQIAEELKTVISPVGIEQIEKKPTENLEAYNLYLKGRFFWHRRTEEDLKKSIYFFNQALELDSDYALAYAGLADTYFIMGWWGWLPKNKGFTKGKEYAQKAISIDNTIAEAHATLGGIITWDEWNWEEAEKELKMAISLNPNYATAHHYYYELLDIIGRNKEAREHLDLALKLNPYSIIMTRQSAYAYYDNLEYQKAVEGFHKAIDLEVGNNMLIHVDKLGLIKCYVNLGWSELAIESIKNFTSTDPSIDYRLIDEIFIKSGIDGLMIWFVNWLSVNKSEKYVNNILMASFYSITGDSQNALKYLDLAFNDGDTGMPFINKSPDFNLIKTEPRYIALLKKMGLEDK